jgi:uncharacterized protein YjbI with pentapeptide repeats
MSEQQPVTAIAVQERPAPEGYNSWLDYWKAQGMPWRTEPEIETERQRYLAERRAVAPDIETGIYPCRDPAGRIILDRADVEWLLATHESGGMRGPVDRSDPDQRGREGVDIRGADLRRADLRGLPLARVRGGLDAYELLEVGRRHSIDTAHISGHGPGALFEATAAQREMAGVQLTGASLRGVDMSDGVLGSAHLEGVSLLEARLESAYLEGAHLEWAYLGAARLDEADLAGAHLQGADLSGAHLERASLTRAQLGGKRMAPEHLQVLRLASERFPDVLTPAVLCRVFFDPATTLDHVRLGGKEYGAASVADVRWGGVNLAVVDWASVHALGYEDEARQSRGPGAPEGRMARLARYEKAVRANRQLATVLRAQGLNEHADYFAYRAQRLQVVVVRLQRRLLRYAGSCLLDWLAGFGYRPMRSFITYILVILAFAAGYFTLGGVNGQSLSWNEAIVISMTAFHGRGFFSAVFQPGDLQAAVAAVEAFIGLLIEIVFIATFTQRFFAR